MSTARILSTNQLKIKRDRIYLKMNFFLLLNSFLFAGFLNSGNCNKLQCFIPGECTNSQEINILPSLDEFQCLEICQQDANCTWFSFFPDSNFCQMFSSCGSIEDTFCSNCISGQRECESTAPICFMVK